MIKTSPLLENSISLEEDGNSPHPSLIDCLMGALQESGCEVEAGELTPSYHVRRFFFEGKIVATSSSWFDPDDEESVETECRVDLDRDFAREWWNVLTASMLPKYLAEHLSYHEVEAEVFEWSPLDDTERERFARRCAKEIQDFFDQLD